VRRFRYFIVVSIVVSLLFSSAVSAVDSSQKDRGLLVTPLRDYITVDPGKTAEHKIGVANLTPGSMDITLYVEQFSVANYTYDYKFDTPKEDWIKLQTTQLQLTSGKSKEVLYKISVPKGAAPGGHYFTIFAAAKVNDAKEIRAAVVLYVTVSGDLIQTSTIEKEKVPGISFGGNIPFSLDVKGTGNTHFFVYVSGRLETWWQAPKASETAHLLLPKTIRTVGSEIASPVLPGVYKAVYGFRTESGQRTERSKLIVYLPPWSIAIPVGVGWFVFLLIKRHKRLSHDKLNT
jgi:hypothetical protein